jgi:hypothetical protein
MKCKPRTLSLIFNPFTDMAGFSSEADLTVLRPLGKEGSPFGRYRILIADRTCEEVVNDMESLGHIPQRGFNSPLQAAE